eukprot:gene9363-10338_t
MKRICFLGLSSSGQQQQQQQKHIKHHLSPLHIIDASYQHREEELKAMLPIPPPSSSSSSSSSSLDESSESSLQPVGAYLFTSSRTEILENDGQSLEEKKKKKKKTKRQELHNVSVPSSTPGVVTVATSSLPSHEISVSFCGMIKESSREVFADIAQLSITLEGHLFNPQSSLLSNGDKVREGVVSSEGERCIACKTYLSVISSDPMNHPLPALMLPSTTTTQQKKVPMLEIPPQGEDNKRADNNSDVLQVLPEKVEANDGGGGGGEKSPPPPPIDLQDRSLSVVIENEMNAYHQQQLQEELIERKTEKEDNEEDDEEDEEEEKEGRGNDETLAPMNDQQSNNVIANLRKLLSKCQKESLANEELWHRLRGVKESSSEFEAQHDDPLDELDSKSTLVLPLQHILPPSSSASSLIKEEGSLQELWTNLATELDSRQEMVHNLLQAVRICGQDLRELREQQQGVKTDTPPPLRIRQEEEEEANKELLDRIGSANSVSKILQALNEDDSQSQSPKQKLSGLPRRILVPLLEKVQSSLEETRSENASLVKQVDELRSDRVALEEANREIDRLRQTQGEQEEVIRAFQKERTRLMRYRETIEMQEKVIIKMQSMMESKLRSKFVFSNGITTIPGGTPIASDGNGKLDTEMGSLTHRLADMRKEEEWQQKEEELKQLRTKVAKQEEEGKKLLTQLDQLQMELERERERKSLEEHPASDNDQSPRSQPLQLKDEEKQEEKAVEAEKEAKQEPLKDREENQKEVEDKEENQKEVEDREENQKEETNEMEIENDRDNELLKEQVREKENENEMLKEQVEQKEKEKEMLKEQLQQKEKDYDTLKEQVEEKEKDYDMLKEQVQEKENENDMLKEQVQEKEREVEKLGEKLQEKEEKEKAQKQEEEDGEKVTNLTKAKLKIDQLAAENVSKGYRIEALERQLETSSRESAREVAQLRTKVLDLELKLAMAQAMQQSDNENDDYNSRSDAGTRQNSDRFLPPEEAQEPSNAIQSPSLQDTSSTNPPTNLAAEDHANPEGS